MSYKFKCQTKSICHLVTMTQEIENAILEYLKSLKWEWKWATPSEIMDTIYPKFQKQYPDEATFKRLLFRALKNNPKIIKNFHSPHYAYKRRGKLTKDEIQFLEKLFEMVRQGRAWRGYDPKFKNIPQYPDIPLERTDGLKHAYYILSRLWKDPRDEIIINATRFRASRKEGIR